MKGKAKPSLAREFSRVCQEDKGFSSSPCIYRLAQAVLLRTGPAYKNHPVLKPPKYEDLILVGLFSRPPIVEISASLRH